MELIHALQPHPEDRLHLRLHRARSVVLTAQEYVPRSASLPARYAANTSSSSPQTRRDTRRATDVRGGLYTHGVGAVLVCACGAQDLHCRVLQYRRIIRDVRSWDFAGEHVPAV